VGRVSPGILAGRRNTIVAGLAVVNDTGMVEYRWCKGSAGYVTDNAILVCGNMVDFRDLACCIGTIVAGIAPVTDNVRVAVIDKRGDKYSRAMAYGAVRGCVLMDWRIRLSYGPGCNIIHTPIVTGDTITGDTHMQKRCYRESKISFRVANITILVGWQMADWFSRDSDSGSTEPTIVTTFATPVNALMNCIKKRCRRKNISGNVTDTAIILCRNVIKLLAGCDTRVMT